VTDSLTAGGATLRALGVMLSIFGCYGGYGTLMFARWMVRGGAFVALTALVGCSGSGGPTATISGQVTHNGSPVDGARVTLHSTVEIEGKRGNSYAGLTDSSGKYLIAAVGKDPGIPPGMYKVTITKLDQKGKTPTEGMDQGQLEASGAARNTLPKDYENVNTTKLSVTLEAGKNADKNFELKGKAGSSGGGGVPVP
jgi:hypothetical protein